MIRNSWKDKQVTWRGETFNDIYELAEWIDREYQLIVQQYKKFDGYLDFIHPGRNSEYFDVNVQTDEHSYIAQAVREYGVKHVARALCLTPKSIRQRRSRGTLWELAFPYGIKDHPKCKYRIGISEDELYYRINNPKRVPFVYLLHWSNTDKYYVGSRTCQGCHPSDLFRTYWTSCTKVKAHIKEYGLPDVILTKIFTTSEETLLSEAFCLTLASISDVIFSKYLNTHNWVDTYNVWTVKGRRTNHMAWERGKID